MKSRGGIFLYVKKRGPQTDTVGGIPFPFSLVIGIEISGNYLFPHIMLWIILSVFHLPLMENGDSVQV